MMKETDQQEQSVDQPLIRRTKRCCIVSVILIILGVILFVVVPTTVVASKSKSSSRWASKEIKSDLETTMYLKLGGTWSDRLLLVGTERSKFIVENHKYNEDDSVERTGVFDVDGNVVAVGVNELVSRVVLALDAPLRFNVYDRSGESWSLFGSPIFLNDIAQAGADGHSPTVMLSDDGKILSLAIQGSKAGVFTFEEADESTNATIAEKWGQRGEPLFDYHNGSYGNFATFASISGDATTLAVTSEFQRLSLYRYIGDRWANFAEYDESPRTGLGSLSLSGDGSTVAVGSFEGARKGIGQLHIINAVWPWYLDEGRESSFDIDNVNLQAVLSRWGTTVLIGRFPMNGQQASLEVFDYIQLENKWQSRDGPFGMADSSSPGLVDLSTDGFRATAIINGKVSLFEYQHR